MGNTERNNIEKKQRERARGRDAKSGRNARIRGLEENPRAEGKKRSARETVTLSGAQKSRGREGQSKG